MIRSLLLALSLPVLILTAVYLIERPGLEHPFGKKDAESAALEDLPVKKKSKKPVTLEKVAAPLEKATTETVTTVTATGAYETQVEDSGETLSLISMRLYGTSKRWQEIAEANDLQAPYPVRVGQILKLTTAPTLDVFEGRIEILKHYRKKFGLSLTGPDYDRAVTQLAKAFGKEIPARLPAAVIPVVAPAAAPKTAPTIAPVPVIVPEIKEAKKPEIQSKIDPKAVDDEFQKQGITFLKEKNWKKAIEHFSKRPDGFLKAPEDPEVIWYSGSLAEVVFQRLNMRREIPGRKPAAMKNERGAIQGWVAEWSDNLVCFNVPTRAHRKDGFGYRCVGMKTAQN